MAENKETSLVNNVNWEELRTHLSGIIENCTTITCAGLGGDKLKSYIADTVDALILINKGENEEIDIARFKYLFF